MIASISDSLTYWLSFNVIPTRVYGQLWAVIFDKTLRKKHTRGYKPVNDNDSNETESPSENIISIASIDVQRVVDCTTLLYALYEAPIKFSISGILIARLLGWQSLLLGLISLVVVMPVNCFFGQRYRRNQASLLQSRDMRMEVLSEALEGIRQIKMSASEHHWEGRINGLRDSEMVTLEASWFWQILIFSYFNICPIVVSSVALATYMLRAENPSGSVIFTSLSTFAAIEATLTMFPQTLINCLNTRLSLDRIVQYLESPERHDISLPSDRVSFEQATISWTSPSSSSMANLFALRNTSLSFPPGQLSIISGSTGSGKSLLLAAILGECEILSGIVRAPKPKIDISPANMKPGDPWILDSAIAFVPQSPWIENGTVRSNILLGLPYNETRYWQVLDSCALTKDLQTLVDGDHTEIGPKGVNLSGGQKWRIALARALYSRADILVIDDIFSAVDAYTARHLCDHALTGPIVSSRTRILATHHLHLCISHAAYMVHIENGKMTGVDGSYVMKDKIEQEAHGQGAQDDEMEGFNPVSLEETATPQHTRAFVTQEEREQGSIKWSTYKAYVDNTGGIRYLFSVLLAYMAYGFFTLERASVALCI
ncbi:hypothetical protein EYZ11_011045 [Aspergillus tanneri]|uniref:ABC transporter domain-containing protein n=1 Tax=Aspergillus tanneri TaxID=1220188 RepID=A0A4S3J988_9EURO|nr:hypothetical protein EYZ11_011045 [Aspergillus tanneri]